MTNLRPKLRTLYRAPAPKPAVYLETAIGPRRASHASCPLDENMLTMGSTAVQSVAAALASSLAAFSTTATSAARMQNP